MAVEFNGNIGNVLGFPDGEAVIGRIDDSVIYVKPLSGQWEGYYTRPDGSIGFTLYYASQLENLGPLEEYKARKQFDKELEELLK